MGVITHSQTGRTCYEVSQDQRGGSFRRRDAMTSVRLPTSLSGFPHRSSPESTPRQRSRSGAMSLADAISSTAVAAVTDADAKLEAPAIVDDVARPEHAFYAFDALYCELTGGHPRRARVSGRELVSGDVIRANGGGIQMASSYVFCLQPAVRDVNTRSSRPGRQPRLRGCIGTFEPHRIREGLEEYAIISGLKDTRFNPIRKSELPTLECL